MVSEFEPTPLVSVVIPAFNAEGFVAVAIRSVLAQTHSNLELVVIDDGSTDRTAEIASAFVDARMRVISHPNHGAAAARNRGISETSGELIAFLDADDRWDPPKLSRQVNALSSYPDCVAMGCVLRYESLEGKVLGRTGQKAGPDDQDQISGGRLMPFPLSSILFRRAAIERIGHFDESLRLAQDLDLVARIAAVGIVDGLDEALGAYVVHTQSASAQQLRSQRKTTRFIRERIARRAQNEDLAWEEFENTYHPTWRQSYGDLVQASYRRSAECFAEKRWMKATGAGVVAVFLGPRYTLRRLRKQLPRIGSDL